MGRLGATSSTSAAVIQPEDIEKRKTGVVTLQHKRQGTPPGDAEAGLVSQQNGSTPVAEAPVPPSETRCGQNRGRSSSGAGMSAVSTGATDDRGAMSTQSSSASSEWSDGGSMLGAASGMWVRPADLQSYDAAGVLMAEIEKLNAYKESAEGIRNIVCVWLGQTTSQSGSDSPIRHMIDLSIKPAFNSIAEVLDSSKYKVSYRVGALMNLIDFELQNTAASQVYVQRAGSAASWLQRMPKIDIRNEANLIKLYVDSEAGWRETAIDEILAQYFYQPVASMFVKIALSEELNWWEAESLKRRGLGGFVKGYASVKVKPVLAYLREASTWLFG